MRDLRDELCEIIYLTLAMTMMPQTICVTVVENNINYVTLTNKHLTMESNTFRGGGELSLHMIVA